MWIFGRVLTGVSIGTGPHEAPGGRIGLVNVGTVVVDMTVELDVALVGHTLAGENLLDSLSQIFPDLFQIEILTPRPRAPGLASSTLTGHFVF